MTDFRPDCTISLHVETRGKPAKLTWACSISHAKRGLLVRARGFSGLVPHAEAELAALLFGLRQTQRLLQEKVEVAATFPVEELLSKENRRLAPGLRPQRDEAVRIWESFRLRRMGKVSPGAARELREEAEGSYRRRGSG
jgi:hypothetical protein